MRNEIPINLLCFFLKRYKKTGVVKAKNIAVTFGLL
jgi:hypothetical protein